MPNPRPQTLLRVPLAQHACAAARNLADILPGHIDDSHEGLKETVSAATAPRAGHRGVAKADRARLLKGIDAAAGTASRRVARLAAAFADDTNNPINGDVSGGARRALHLGAALRCCDGLRPGELPGDDAARFCSPPRSPQPQPPNRR